MSTLSERYENIAAAAGQAAEQCGRRPDEVKLLAVSKTFPADCIRELYAHGVRDFGESRLPELAVKSAELPSDIVWHFIGTLQSNKVRKVIQLADWIHSVNSRELLERVDRIAGEERRRIHVLLEINISGEESKAGADAAEAAALIARAAQCGNIQFDGFMTMAPANADEIACLTYFRALSALRDRAREQYHLPLNVLSMGMSGDFPIAIRGGSTLIRVGSAIFGAR